MPWSVAAERNLSTPAVVGGIGVEVVTIEVGAALPATTETCRSRSWISRPSAEVGRPSGEMVPTEMVRCQPSPDPRLSTRGQRHRHLGQKVAPGDDDTIGYTGSVRIADRWRDDLALAAAADIEAALGTITPIDPVTG